MTIKKAFAQIGHIAASRYKRELHRYLLKRLRTPEDADDLAQEVYLRLLRMDDSKLVREPLAYLYGIASNVVADFWMESEREQRSIDGDPVEQWSDDPSIALPDDIAERMSLQQQLERALAQLPPLQAAVLLAHERDGLSYQEVAAKLKISIHTVEKYLTRAKARIRTMAWDR